MFFKKRRDTDLPPEWIVVGLGNPGPEYRDTRHNVGFMVLDKLAERYRCKLSLSQHKARYGVVRIDDVVVALAKPLTFMNLSGESVAPLMRKWGLEPSHVLVVADDLDMPLGKVRFRLKGGSGGHNGHKSIGKLLGTEEYPRIKIGIGRAKDEEAVGHVLGEFAFEERGALAEALDEAVQKVVETVTSRGLAPQLDVDPE